MKLWDAWQAGKGAGESNRAYATRLEREFLSMRKLREWVDVHAQLAEAVAELHWAPNAEPAGYEPLHRALLAGLLGNLGCRAPEEPYYLGTHATRFWLHPGSGLSKRSSARQQQAADAAHAEHKTEASGSARWVMAAEIVDTARTYARTVARIDPIWVEQAAGHLIQRSTSDPAWSKQSGQAFELERGMIYGLVLYSQRRVPLAPRNPTLARELLIREGLVGDGIEAKLPFLLHNRRLIAEIEKLEQKIRRPDLLVDDQFLFDWYDARLPERVTSLQRLEQWLAKAAPDEAKALMLSREQLMRREETGVASDARGQFRARLPV